MAAGRKEGVSLGTNVTSSCWVFLGDSLTEGVGASRVSYVTELALQLRRAGSGERAVHELRLRKVDPDGYNRFVRFNLAGHLNADPRPTRRALWIWNLACEGRTVDTDLEWLPMIQNLRPELVIVHRGSLESIVRPAMLRDDSWPAWVPESWRGYAALDPRCYFSTTWWRRAKQTAIDRLKQATRHHLLRQRRGNPLMDVGTLITHYRQLLESLRGMSAHILVLGLIPPDGARFPGSPEHFSLVNGLLRALATAEGAEFFDWGPLLAAKHEPETLFYRDGFHPNQAGARVLAGILHERVSLVPAR